METVFGRKNNRFVQDERGKQGGLAQRRHDKCGGTHGVAGCDNP